MKKLLALFFVASIFFVSCTKEEVIPEPTVNPNDEVYQVNNNDLELSQRLTFINEPLKLDGILKSGNPTFTLLAEAASPTVNGVKLSASFVLKRGNNIYVSYHERGNGYGGAIVVYNVSNITNPTIISQMTFTKTDINAVDINQEGTFIYLAGSNRSKGAVVLKTSLLNTGALSQNFGNMSITKVGEAYSANGVIQGGNWVYVSAGNSVGGLYMYNKNTMAFEDADYYTGAKYSTANGRANGKNHLSFEAGPTSSYLHVYVIGTDDTQVERVFSVGPTTHQNVEPEFVNFGKNAMFIKPNSDICYIARGMYGMKAFKITNGAMVYKSPEGMITNGNTNGVGADNDFVYMANGAQGLFIAAPPVNGSTLNIVGVWDDPNYPGSANMVYSDNTHIFVAKGQEGGLKILLKTLYLP
ncbi:MAG: hypothetical protein Q7J34_11235 [Bacteroidales bacterium]|nr:hypothetical protein [Bacteroidales bacterium]